jgi:tetratricopeptide (TPR) repeat protein
VEDEVVIFAEFAERGSLATLIRQRWLTSLVHILDTAIQFAWGLHAAHELGLVHQDVKPGNALVTRNGLVKISDFGLARARAKTEGAGSIPAWQSILVSYSGMTPAYCSPEQAQGRPLSRKTDVWSWGLAVLEMFVGEVTWRSGVAAPEVLKAYLKRPPGSGLPAMPKDVAEVLKKCFRGESDERWASLAKAAEALRQAYRQAVGKEHSRTPPAVPGPSRQSTATHDRRMRGVQWDDPREWLIKAFEADGRDPAQIDAFLSSRGGSRKAQAIADLAAYDEARRIFERLVTAGRNNLETQLAILCLEKALVHDHTDDVPGAVALYDRAIAIYERLVEREGQKELSNLLAAAYMNKAVAVSDLGDKQAAVALYDRAIAIRERLVEREGRRELANDLAAAFLNKANAVDDLGDKQAAVALYDRAIAIYERLVEREGRKELADRLAAAYLNKAVTVDDLGDKQAAVALYDRAIAIRERLVEREGRKELANGLAAAYMNKANAVSDLGDKRAAVALYDRAIAIRERLVEREGRKELQGDLAWVLAGRAKAWLDLGDHHKAQGDAQKAVPLLNAEIARTGRADLQGVLNWATEALREVL